MRLVWKMVILGICLLHCHGNSKDVAGHEILTLLLNTSRYDPKISPHYEDDRPTIVTIQIYILGMDSLSELSKDFSLEIFLRQTWYDFRLNYSILSTAPYLELDSKIMNMVWIPDTFFLNEKSGRFHKITKPNKLVHIYRNGTIYYSLRLSLKLSCDFDLHNYPLDEQICPIHIESFGYTTKHLVFQWQSDDPVTVHSIYLPQFTFAPVVTYTYEREHEDQIFSRLQADIHLVRNIDFYMAQVFLPSILIVILSWVSFWIDIEATTARTSVGVLTILTMTTQFACARASLPRVSYIKAIDIWMASCLGFVFVSLIEYAHINVLSRKLDRYFCGKIEEISPMKDADRSTRSVPTVRVVDHKKRAREIDKIARVIFPLAFTLFNLWFWIYFIYISTNKK